MFTNDRTKMFKILVQCKPHSIELAHYIDNHILNINNIGIFINMEKIGSDDDEKIVGALRKRGITRLPAMILDNGQVVVGKDKIIDLFKMRLQGDGYNNNDVGCRTDYGTNPDMADFWMHELYSDTDGKKLPKNDTDEDNNEGNDIDRRLRNYDSNIPKHRRGGATSERDFDQTTSQRKRRSNNGPPEIVDNTTNDNVDDIDEPRGNESYMNHNGGGPRGGNITGLSGDAMDEKMMTAWMQNNPVGEY